MTEYLKPGPFSVPVSNGKMSNRDYDIAVGALVWCWRCEGYVKPGHGCPQEIK